MTQRQPLTPDLLRASMPTGAPPTTCRSARSICCDNPLLKRPLALADVKRMLLGHWGTTPGQNFIYAHLNRVIKQYDLDMIYVCGPGHGGPAVVANTYLEGTLQRDLSRHQRRTRPGLRKLFRQFSFPGGIPSHASPEMPGLDPRGRRAGLLAQPRVRRGVRQPRPGRRLRRRRRRGGNRAAGDGLAFEQVPRSRHRRRGAADPASERLQDRQPDRARAHHARGAGAAAARLRLDAATSSRATSPRRCTRRWRRRSTRPSSRSGPSSARRARTAARERPRWPMIVLDSPKGWTGPKVVDGLPIEGTFRSHQVPLSDPAAQPAHLQMLEDWLRSYRPQELFDAQGRLQARAGRARAARASAAWARIRTPTAGCCCASCACRTSATTRSTCPRPACRGIGDTRVLGPFLRDVVKLNEEQRNFRVFGPDETVSNGLERRCSRRPTRQWDAATAAERRVAGADRPRDGDAQRAPVRGLARGLPADRPARALQLLRGLHPHRRLDVQPARQVAEGDGAAAVAATDRLAELPARLARLAPGPQRLLAPGSRASSTTW